MRDTTDYKAIFEGVESALIRVGNQDGRAEDMNRRLERFKSMATRTFTDADYFQKMVHIVFYAGFKAARVEQKRSTIDGHLPDHRTVASYGSEEVRIMLADPAMIRNKAKIQACIDNARTFKALVDQNGSFQSYVDSFSPKLSFANLMRLREDLIERFAFISKITAYHFLTDIGMDVLKPDRVISRIFSRLELIDGDGKGTTEDDLSQVVDTGRRLAQATQQPIRYVDIVFVSYGQMKSEGIGVEQGICLEKDPRCNLCAVTNYCRYFAQKQSVKT